ncbi:MAG TPA: hypothetical protein VMT22_05605 [Terriglobales bacterium]|nr:hypothetical protein [Terriglobales bacterium]
MEKFQLNSAANPVLRKGVALYAHRFLGLFQRSPDNRKSARFIAGSALIAASFLVYLAYPIILLILPLSRSVKVGATIGVWILSWGVFSAGIFLAGPDGLEWFKDNYRRTIGTRGLKAKE